MDKSLSVHVADRATAPTSESDLNSPTRIVNEMGQPFHRRLEAPCPNLPLLEELRLAGGTDYVICPLPFLDRTRTAVISFATQRPRSFDQAWLDRLEFATKLLSPYIERHVLRRIAIDLLDTYVGPRTGQRMIEGRVDRGAVEMIKAAIWFSDLRGFTLLSEQTPIPAVLADLNAWFGTIGEVVETHGGEVLKFIGDAVLAIFPTSGEHDHKVACRKAMAAAQEFCRRAEAQNALRCSSGNPPLSHALALHVGEVAYGNVGAAHRLDFTVIAPAVNRASRLLDLAKRLDHQVLGSHAVAREVDELLVDLRHHQLRGVSKPQRVFTLPKQDDASSH